jgi:hypothetical protein
MDNIFITENKKEFAGLLSELAHYWNDEETHKNDQRIIRDETQFISCIEIDGTDVTLAVKKLGVTEDVHEVIDMLDIVTNADEILISIDEEAEAQSFLNALDDYSTYRSMVGFNI